jgi:1-acyl-sn-glycerol-3-phosphate acyltransferase
VAEKTLAPPPGICWQYRTVTRIFGPALFKVLGGFQVQGQEHIPDLGAGLICPNHISYLDPPVVGIANWCRRSCFMAKESLFRIPVLGPFIRSSYCYPVDREEGGRQALRIAMDLLEAGELVTIFPEGTRSHTGELIQAKSGAAFVAFRTRVPVIPVAVWGTNLIMPVHSMALHRAPVYVRFGEPITPPEPDRGDRPSKHQLQEFTGCVMESIAALQVRVRSEVPPQWRAHELHLQAQWRERLALEQEAAAAAPPSETPLEPGEE